MCLAIDAPAIPAERRYFGLRRENLAALTCHIFRLLTVRRDGVSRSRVSCKPNDLSSPEESVFDERLHFIDLLDGFQKNTGK